MRFKKWLTDYRKNQGMTQSEFANLIGVTVQSIGYYEIGQRFPAIRVIRKLSEITGVEVKKIRQMIKYDKRVIEKNANNK